MRTFHVAVAIRILEIYQVEAQDEASAAEAWTDGDLIHTNDAALDSEILSVREAQP